jgi:hypothetical protein
LSRIAGWLLGDSPAGVEKKFVSGEETVREEVSRLRGSKSKMGVLGGEKVRARKGVQA